MGNESEPVLTPLALEIANYIKEAKTPKDMAGYIAIAELIIERVKNEPMGS